MKKVNNRGFSLVELVISMAILGLIMVAIASFMATTTSVYTKSRDDVAIQEDGQEVYDLISDKIMQAKRIRIGTANAEYAIVGSDSTDDVGADGVLTVSSGGAPVSTATVDGNGSRPLKAFHMFTAEIDASSGELVYKDSSRVAYIAVLYETNMDDSDDNPCYGEVVDVYFFSENSIYLFRYNQSVRKSAKETPAATATEPTIVNMDQWLRTSISDAASKMSVLTSSNYGDYLLCNTLDYDSTTGKSDVHVYVNPGENAVYLSMGFKKNKAENSVGGLVTIRNSYVLQPRKYAVPSTETTSSVKTDGGGYLGESSTGDVYYLVSNIFDEKFTNGLSVGEIEKKGEELC